MPPMVASQSNASVSQSEGDESRTRIREEEWEVVHLCLRRHRTSSNALSPAFACARAAGMAEYRPPHRGELTLQPPGTCQVPRPAAPQFKVPQQQKKGSAWK